MRVFDLLNATIDTDEEAEVTPTPEPQVETQTVEDPHRHDLDWAQQNLRDAEQQAEIDLLKLEIAALKSAAPAPTATTTPAIVANQSTFGRKFNVRPFSA